MTTSRQRFALVVAVVAGLLLLAPVGAFGSISGERPLSIDVADSPEDGIVGVLEAPEETALTYGSNDGQGNDDAVTGHSGPVTLLVLQNNHDAAMTLDADLDGDVPSPPMATQFGFASGGQSTTISPGATATVRADIVCAPQSPENWTVALTATAPGLEVTAEHEVTVSCTGPPGGGSGGPPIGGSGGPSAVSHVGSP